MQRTGTGRRQFEIQKAQFNETTEQHLVIVQGIVHESEPSLDAIDGRDRPHRTYYTIRRLLSPLGPANLLLCLMQHRTARRAGLGVHLLHAYALCAHGLLVSSLLF